VADKELVYVAIIKTHRANGDDDTDYRETKYSPDPSGADGQNLDGTRKRPIADDEPTNENDPPLDFPALEQGDRRGSF
jgi:hypothetical protein